MSAHSYRAYKGTFVQTPSLGKLDILEDYRLVTNHKGFIVAFDRVDNFSEVFWSQEIVIPKGSFTLPTFCDLHLHAPQYLYQGNGFDLPLAQWLEAYALGPEAELDSNPSLARNVYRKLANRLLMNGTGTVSLFGTIGEETNMILAEEMQRAGIRAFIGKISTDISSHATYKEESAEVSLKSAKSFAFRCRALMEKLQPHERLIEPVLTLRFIPTCSDNLLQGLGTLSEEEDLKIQSHLAVTPEKHGFEDISVFAKHNLLTPRTIQAHCTFLSPPDLSRVREYETAIAHCPLSNTYFSAEPFKLREALNQNVKIGLGTDIAGGYSTDIMNAMRQAVAVSRTRQLRRMMQEVSEQNKPSRKEGNENLAIDWKESLYLATKGGTIALGLNSGSFQVGAPFDAQMIALTNPDTGEGVGALDYFEDVIVRPVTEAMVEKWWCVGDDRNRRAVWVQGSQVFQRK